MESSSGHSLSFCHLVKYSFQKMFLKESLSRELRIGEWESLARTSVNHTDNVAVVTPTDRPKWVHNRCVIEYFGSFFGVVSLHFEKKKSVGVGVCH